MPQSSTPFKDYKNPLVAIQAAVLTAVAAQLETRGNVNAAAEVKKVADGLAAQVQPKSGGSRGPVKMVIDKIQAGLGNVQPYLSKSAQDALTKIVASLRAAASTIDDKAQAALSDVLDAVSEMVSSGISTALGDGQMIFQTISGAIADVKTQITESGSPVSVKTLVTAIANSISFLNLPSRAEGAATESPRPFGNLRTRLQARRAPEGAAPSPGPLKALEQHLLQALKGNLPDAGGHGVMERVLGFLNRGGAQADGEELPFPGPLLAALKDRIRRPRSGIAEGDATAEDVQVSDPVIVEILRYMQPLLNGTPLESTEFVLFVAPHDAAVKVATMAVNNGLIKPERYSATVERLDRLYEEAKYNTTELSDTVIYGGTKIAVPIGMDIAAIVVQVLNQIVEIVINIVYQVVVKIPGISFIPLPSSIPPLLTAFVSPLISSILRDTTLQAYLAVAVYLLLDVPFEVADRIALRVFEKMTPQETDTVRSRVLTTIISNLESI